MEQRRAYDGHPYSFEEYVSWYGEKAVEAWHSAPEVRQHSDGHWYTQEELEDVLQRELEREQELDLELQEMVLDGILAEVKLPTTSIHTPFHGCTELSED